MAFKKPFQDLKTSAPLRSSDRKKLKQRIVQTFSLQPEAGDELVPESILSLKFNTHLGDPGVVYLSPQGDPLWFSLGKVSDELIPTVYTLWRRPTLLPVLSTPPNVIPVLVGGADLMIPGVIHYPPRVRKFDLVAITSHVDGNDVLSPPLAVGKMAVDVEALKEGARGKAVHVLHTFSDSLWDMGSKPEPPQLLQTASGGSSAPAVSIQSQQPVGTGGHLETERYEGACASQITGTVPERADSPSAPLPEASPQEITAILRSSTIQAIETQLSMLPPSSFPMSSSTLYSTYILPSRPLSSQAISTPVDIKHSSYKNLTAFLKTIEKDGLLRLKDIKGDLHVLSVNVSHPEVQAHITYRSVRDKEKGEEKRAEREKVERERVKSMNVRELYKPHAQSVQFFEEIGKSPKDLYSATDLRTIINEYATAHSLVNPHLQQYITPDDRLLSVLVAPKSTETIPYLKREEAAKRLSERMQPWHEIAPDGKDPVIRKGQLKPITVVVKVRQGRKASTLVTGCETFFITPEFMSEELKRICATSTSVSPLPGKGNAMEVLVQGKQIKAATEFLIAQGVPNKWIEATDLSEKK